MANIDNISNWDKIQKGVKDTEHNLSQKKYNMAMINARQTLEYMVRCMGERACIVDSDLAETIDQLFQGKWISKTTCEHYHKIRMIGNRAVHEGNDNAYEANQAYHLLSQEVYTFANDYSGNRPRRSTATNSTSSRTGSGSRASSGNRTGNNRSGNSRNTATNRGTPADRGRKRTRPRKRNAPMVDLLKILIPLALILVLILFIALKPDKKKEPETTEVTTTEETTTMPSTVAPTEAEPTTAAPVYKTTDTLNIRKEPSTNGAKLGVLTPGTTVDYIGEYDNFWSIINYNGQEGYVATQYLSKE